MYIPKKTKKPINLFKVEYSRRSMMVAGVMIGGTILTALYLTLRDFQEKERLDKRHERRVKATYNPRVLIIGSGTGGAAMASLIANGYPEAQVTVVERERKQMFTAMLPLAQVGTRSYDLNSRSGVDYLRSPAAFNVTTEAELIMGEVLEVKPKDNCVIIKPESLNRREDASYTVLKDGTLSHPYDVLVVAGGAQRTLGHLRSYLKQEDIDTYKIAVNPGITRDVLSHMFGGNIIHVKVPPSSFIREKEKERARLKGKVETIEIGLTDTNSNSWENTPYRRLAQFGKVDTAEAQTKTQETVDYYPCRQHDGTFTGTVNMMWGYLDHVKKFPFITYIAATADDQPLGPAPSKVNQAIASFWKRCQANTPNDHFHVLRHSYVTDVDSKNNKVQLYNYKEKVNFILPYTLMLLDLPLLAPSFIQRSGLHRKELEKPVRGVSLEEESHFMDVDPQTLQHKTYPNIFGIGDVAGLPTIKSYGAVFVAAGSGLTQRGAGTTQP
ncbi:hypothetical protein AGDE_11160 [Angomonas deanei]|uniref:Pyridine nucleotide-disulphide oxidoreductase, putative n=1 Tax=Angomonas deanei TaxID=59799 RepID=A0A7G2CDM2_9TRYP|nr:hypothetical protein AGDE_11160 [Angomonas deanei]CAD2216954.1 Pyridine nucleotide-disulphide oxidoreductase, putative [Angomonas deanei]|eukprot:EPY26652.1 hypothetical protein AGDE_11160 [Angomonas deanei]